MKKFCNRCKKFKYKKSFYRDSTKTNGISSRCIICIKEIGKERWAKEGNTPQYKKKKRAYYFKNKARWQNESLKRLYNLSRKDYLLLLKKQKNKCAICNKKASEFKRNLAVDHCHKTGKIRGLLCINCNRGLGSFKDNSLFLKQAKNYLELYATNK